MAIQIKTLDQLKTMRRAGLLVGQTLDLMRESNYGVFKENWDSILDIRFPIIMYYSFLPIILICQRGISSQGLL